MSHPRSHSVVLALAAAASIAALAGCGFVAAGAKSSVKPSAFVISGEAAVTLPTAGAATPGAACTAPVGASDVATGTTVIVTSPSGATLATGRLGAGIVASNGSACSFPFQIRAVIGGYPTYGVAIGNRPPQTFSEGPLRANQLAVLTIAPTAT